VLEPVGVLNMGHVFSKNGTEVQVAQRICQGSRRLDSGRQNFTPHPSSRLHSRTCMLVEKTVYGLSNQRESRWVELTPEEKQQPLS
jgi:hypothetical protein